MEGVHLVFFILNLSSDTTEYKPTSNRMIPIRKIKSKTRNFSDKIVYFILYKNFK